MLCYNEWVIYIGFSIAGIFCYIIGYVFGHSRYRRTNKQIQEDKNNNLIK